MRPPRNKKAAAAGTSGGGQELLPWRAGQEEVVLRFRLTPRASRDQVGGMTQTAEGPAIAAHVRAVPENGAANAALIGLAAGWIGVAKSSIALVSGHKSRIKTLRIATDDAASIAARIDGLLDGRN